MAEIDIALQDARISDVIRRFNEIPLVLIENQAFSGITVQLDGRAFVNCRFSDCRLVTRIGHFRLDLDSCTLEASQLFYETPMSYAATTAERINREGVRVPPKGDDPGRLN